MRNNSSVRVGLIITISCATLFAAFGGLEALFRRGQSGDAAMYIASFACFGFLFGAIVAFDPLPGEKAPDRPLLRIVLGAFSGVCLALLWQWPGEGLALSAIVASALGYAGTAWAKYL